MTEGEGEDFLKDPRDDENVIQGEALKFENEERSCVFETRLEKAREYWEAGKLKFREEDIELSLIDFEKGLYHVEFEELSYNFELLDTHREQIEKIRVPLWLNAAACLVKLNRTKEAIEYCDKVLKQEPKNVKALFRRARANEKLGHTETALMDLEKAQEYDKENMEISRALASLRKRSNMEQKKADEIWKGRIKIKAKQVSKTSTETIDSQNDHRFFLIKFFSDVFQWILSILQQFLSFFKSKNQ